MSRSHFIQELLEKQKTNYRNIPEELLGHYNGEQEIKQDYQGRQLLELLQNADDAGAGFEGKHKMLFRLTDNYFVAANTGVPFSEKGIRSLMIPHLSPKQLAAERQIGYKGLGFRSLLSWSRSPLVLSDDLAFTFDPAYALSQVEALAETISDPPDDIVKFAAKYGHWPAPILKFPKILSPDDAWYQEAKAILEIGYNTVILIPLQEQASTEEDADDDAQTEPNKTWDEIYDQLWYIWGECLIFSQHLEELEIEIREDRWHWQLTREQLDDTRQQVLVEDLEGGDLHEWTVEKRRYPVPEEFMAEQPEKSHSASYEVAVALPKALEVFETSEYLAKLHVYFPTNLHVPLKILLHATLALDSSRKHLNDSGLNRHILAKLAELAADVLEAHQQTAQAFDAVTRIAALEKCSSQLKKLGFVDAMKTQCQERALFHNQAGVLRPIGDLMVPEQFQSYEILLTDYFPNVLRQPADKEQLEQIRALFDTQEIPPDFLRHQIETYAKTMNPRQIGELLAHLHTALPRNALDQAPALLRDHKGQLIDLDGSVFLPPEDTRISLPDWASDLCFVHSDIVMGFRSTAPDSPSFRQISSALQQLGYAQVEEYNFRSVLTHLYESCDGSPEQHRDLLRLIFLTSPQSALPSSLGIKVLSSEGQAVAPKDCYLGHPYPQGELLQALLVGMPITFVGSPAELGLDDAELTQVEKFLCHLGIKRDIGQLEQALTITGYAPEYPDQYLNAYINHAFRSFTYPLALPQADRTPNSPEDLKDLCKELTLSVSLPAHLQQILSQASPEAILAWIVELRQTQVIRQGEQPQARLSYTLKRKPLLADHLSLPDPTWFLLRHIPWLMGEDGQRYMPAQLFLPSGQLDSFLASSYVPLSLDYSHPLLQQHAAQLIDIDRLLQELGVVRDLSSLDSEGIYTLLLNLPDTDPQGQAAGRIYRKFLESEKTWEDSPAQRRFFSEGMLWGLLRGEEAYFPLHELRYNAGRTVTRSLRDQLPIPLVDIDPKRSKHSVDKLFGVKALQETDFHLSVHEQGTLAHPQAEHFLRLIRKRLPYVLAYRLNQTRELESQERRVYQSITFRVCSQLKVELRWGSELEQHILEDWEGYVPIRDADGSTTLFLTYRPELTEPDELFWMTLGEGLADASDVPNEGDTFVRLFETKIPDQILRHKLLERADEYLEKAKHILSFEPEKEPARKFAIPAPIAPPSRIESEAEPLRAPEQDVQGHLPVATVHDQQATSPQRVAPSAYMRFSAPVSRTSNTPRRRKFVKSTGPSGQRTKVMNVFDELTSLQLVMQYEENEGRFPLLVSHIQGTEGFGCDIISVGSLEDQQLIERTGSVSSYQILRYIEAKGRRARNNRIGFSDNELDRAKEMADKYYLYVLYDEGQERYEMAILQNPWGSDAKVETVVFDLRVSQQVERVQITEPSV